MFFIHDNNHRTIKVDEEKKFKIIPKKHSNWLPFSKRLLKKNVVFPAEKVFVSLNIVWIAEDSNIIVCHQEDYGNLHGLGN